MKTDSVVAPVTPPAYRNRLISGLLLSLALLLVIVFAFVVTNKHEFHLDNDSAVIKQLVESWNQDEVKQSLSSKMLAELIASMSFVQSAELVAADSVQAVDDHHQLFFNLGHNEALSVSILHRDASWFGVFKSWQLVVVLVLLLAIFIVSWQLWRLEKNIGGVTRFLQSVTPGGNAESFDNLPKVAGLKQLVDAASQLAETYSESAEHNDSGFDEINRFLYAFEHSPTLMACITTELEVAYINKAFKDRLGASYTNNNVRELLPEQLEEILNNSLLQNQIVHGIETKNDERHVMWSFVPMPAQGEVYCYGVDITEIRAAEGVIESAYVDTMKAQDESDAKSAFLANMSHEIRTPLTAILGFSESLLDSRQTMEDRVVSINTIIRNAQHLLSIINDLLDITRIEAGEVMIDNHETSLSEVIEDIYRNYSRQASEKGVVFKLVVDYPLPACILTDSVRIRQILFNLCNNAIKFTDEGKITLHVGYENKSQQLIMSVKDTGPGVVESEQAEIFERFRQADSSYTRGYGGAGLGLYISKQLAEHMGGDILLESSPGKGSEFIALIKAAAVVSRGMIERDITAGFTVTEQQNDHQVVQGRVLLAEDSLDNQNLIKMYLQKMGAEVELANNGMEAVNRVTDADFDLVLMDMQMPVMDGITATKQIKQIKPALPVVMLTANVMKSDEEQCRNIGCADFLTKPISRQEFEKAVMSYLPNAEGHDEVLGPIVSELVNEGPEFYKIVKAYVEQLPGDLDVANEAFEQQDDDLLKRKIHSIKGTSGNMGFLELSQTCAKVEFAITKNDREEIKQLLNTLESLKKRIIAGIAE